MAQLSRRFGKMPGELRRLFENGDEDLVEVLGLLELENIEAVVSQFKAGGIEHMSGSARALYGRLLLEDVEAEDGDAD